MSFPAFKGVIKRPRETAREASLDHTPGWQQLWNLDRPGLHLWLCKLQEGRDYHSWISHDAETPVGIFLRGEPLIATDSEFSPETRVEQILGGDVARRIARLYQRHGTQAFALLDGSFSLIVWDRRSQVVLLVVDKFGCDDIYFSRHRDNFAFGSAPSHLDGPPRTLSPKTAAFFLAQEGFVPAPFTLFNGVESIGRAKLLRIRVDAHGFVAEREAYWHLPNAVTRMPTADAVDRFHSLLADATVSRCENATGILLSGGVDSSLLANLIVKRACGELVALTGTISGNAESESEMRRAAALSSALGIPHEPICIDPRDENLPDEWVKCTASWSGGTRVTLPLFCRLARRMREVFGPHFTTLSGQMADTLADNNYTLSSPGYFARRLLFSSWFLRRLRFARLMSPRTDSRIGGLLVHLVKRIAGIRFSGMLASLLDGLSNGTRFYEGRIFGCGEMPGRSRISCPVLTEEGFEEIADWYSGNYVAPVIERLTPETFYARMVELSMDMCMLHLDARLGLHAMRLSGGNLQFPYLDCRIVNFFADLPYSLRAFYRQPKHVIHLQFKKRGYTAPKFTDRRHSHGRLASAPPADATSSEELLLKGTLGVYFRDLLRDSNLPDCTPELWRLIDESYVEDQIRKFRSDSPGVNYKFIARLAAFEQWSHTREESSIVRAATVS